MQPDASPVSRSIGFVEAQIEVLSHAQPLVRKNKPVILFNRSAALLRFATALFRTFPIFLRF